MATRISKAWRVSAKRHPNQTLIALDPATRDIYADQFKALGWEVEVAEVSTGRSCHELSLSPLASKSDWSRFCDDMDEQVAIIGRTCTALNRDHLLSPAKMDAITGAARKVRDAAYQAGRVEPTREDFMDRYPQDEAQRAVAAKEEPVKGFDARSMARMDRMLPEVRKIAPCAHRAGNGIDILSPTRGTAEALRARLIEAGFQCTEVCAPVGFSWMVGVVGRA